MIRITFEQFIKFSPLEMTGRDINIASNLKYTDKLHNNNYYYPKTIYKGNTADAMIMKIRTQLSGKPADKQVATLTALRLQGFI